MQVRMATLQDAPAIQSIYAPYCSTPISFEMEPPGLAEISRRMEQVLQHYPWLVAIDNEQILGYAYGHKFRERPAYRWSVESSVYVAQNAHGRGVGTLLYKKLLALLKAQGFVSCIGGVTLPNAASEKLHGSFGFKLVGLHKDVGYKCDRWHDVGFFELQLNAPPVMPSEPVDVQQALDAIGGL